MGTCKLCLQKGELVPKSHILSNFLYKSLLGTERKLVEVNAWKIGDKNCKKVYRQTGWNEPNLLCHDCEHKRLNEFESYASMVYNGGTFKAKEAPYFSSTLNGVRVDFVKNLNYRKLKLFMLTTLWRASISKLDIFKQVDLGQHEETIRRMIMNGNPGKENDYPVQILTYLESDSQWKKLISAPLRVKSEQGYTIYIFFIAGMIYYFHIIINFAKADIMDGVLNELGELKIYQIPSRNAKELLDHLLGLSQRR